MFDIQKRPLIKYRCWYQDYMYSVKNINFFSERVELYAGDTIHFNEGIMMQSIGMRDITGKEIFEGDICKVKISVMTTAGLVEKEVLMVVTYYNGVDRESQGSFILKGKNNLIVGIRLNRPIKVVGNIYENRSMLL